MIVWSPIRHLQEEMSEHASTKREEGGCLFSRVLYLSGRNSSGSGQCSGLLWRMKSGTTTVVPLGMDTPWISQQLETFSEFHSPPCQDIPSVPGHRRWEGPRKRKADFDKLRFQINLQLHQCSPIEMLGAPGNKLNWPRTLAFMDILVSIMSFDFSRAHWDVE